MLSDRVASGSAQLVSRTTAPLQRLVHSRSLPERMPRPNLREAAPRHKVSGHQSIRIVVRGRIMH
jgi:hypothetical protein